jgi:hypothetical protein
MKESLTNSVSTADNIDSISPETYDLFWSLGYRGLLPAFCSALTAAQSPRVRSLVATELLIFSGNAVRQETSNMPGGIIFIQGTGFALAPLKKNSCFSDRIVAFSASPQFRARKRLDVWIRKPKKGGFSPRLLSLARSEMI